MAVNEVRQILMNEMGLSRETIRQEMREIVADCVDKYWGNLMKDGHLDKLIRDVVENRLNEILQGPSRSSYKAPLIKEFILEAAQDSMKKFIKDNISISITK